MRPAFPKLRLKRKGLKLLLVRVGREDRGAVLIEFAFVLPILLVLFLGLAEFTEAFSVNRKLATTAGAVSDLVSQQASVNNAFLMDIGSLAEELMKPHATGPLQVVIVSVVSDADGNVTVDWSFPSSAYAQGAPYTLPDEDLINENSSLIAVETTYDFTPAVGSFLGSFEMSQAAYFRPRFAARVSKID